MKKAFRFILAVGASLALVASVSGPASAAPPPPGYPTDQIITTAQHSTLGPIPLHRGFWDSVPDQGFGVDKAWNKHNLWSSEAMRKIMLSPNYIKEWNGNYALTSYAGKYTCDSSDICTLEDQRELTGVHDGRSYGTDYTWPVNGLMGMLTAYCKNPNGEARCPNWVTYSILYPGVSNPYSITALKAPEGGVNPTPAPTSGPAQVQGPDALERQKSAEPESQQLLKELNNGTSALSFSYEPLPETIKNPNK